MPIKSRSCILSLSVLFSAALLTTPAMAGFQWVPPEAVGQPIVTSAPSNTPAPTMVAPAPLPKVIDAPEIISPVVVQGTPAIAAAPVVPPAVSVQTPQVVSSQPVASAPVAAPAARSGGEPTIPPAVAPLPEMAAGAAKPATDVVHGFANQVPLSVALKQILPIGYSYSAKPDVDMGVFVSFEGGRPWRPTLSSALDAVGLGMSEVGQNIVISRLAGAPALPQSVSSVAASAKPAVTMGTPPQFLTLPPKMAADGKDGVIPPAVTVSQAPADTMQMVSADSVKTVQVWKAERGDSLRSVLSAWSHKVGVELEWLAEYDYPLFASINFSGVYEDAVRNLLQGFETAHPQPVGQLHLNPELGQTVLVVRVRGNSNSN